MTDSFPAPPSDPNGWPTTPSYPSQPPYAPYPPSATPAGWAPPASPPPTGGGGPQWGQPPGAPPPTGRGSGGRGRGRGPLVAVAVLVVVALVAGGLTWFVTREDADDAATEEQADEDPPDTAGDDETDDETDGEPTDTTADDGSTATTDEAGDESDEGDESETASPPVCTEDDLDGDPVPMTESGNADLDEAVEEAARFVEEHRGLRFCEPVLVEALEEDAFLERFFETEEKEKESKADEEAFRRVLVAMGLIDSDLDLTTTLDDLLGAGVFGFYDPETGELVVRGDEPTLSTRNTIVHELTHALDDQWFELDRPELDDVDDESGFGFSALTEGSATYVEEQWTATLTPDELLDMQAEQAETQMEALDSLDQLLAIPDVLWELLLAPYELGGELVEGLYDEGGSAAVDAAFGDPPLTAEQIMHIDRYLDHEEPVSVDAPEADGDVIDEGMFGEHALLVLLSEVMSTSDAREAAEGWGGDWYVAWEDGDGGCLRADFAMDTDEDVDELVDALEEWADEAPVDADVETVDDLVRLTTCAG